MDTLRQSEFWRRKFLEQKEVTLVHNGLYSKVKYRDRRLEQYLVFRTIWPRFRFTSSTTWSLAASSFLIPSPTDKIIGFTLNSQLHNNLGRQYIIEKTWKISDLN